MNEFKRLLTLAEAEKREKGILYTPAEINQQPEVWLKTLSLLQSKKMEIAEFMEKYEAISPRGDGQPSRDSDGSAQERVWLLLGAGSSEFVGRAVEQTLRQRLAREVITVSTPQMVTLKERFFIPKHAYIAVSFARSGNSPESLVAFKILQDAGIPQLIITCNPSSALVKEASDCEECYILLLPEETNDQSLAMTSSYTSMTLAGLYLGFLNDQDHFSTQIKSAVEATRTLIEEYGGLIHQFARKPFTRACYLGTNALAGTMHECRLKMQEMTNGAVACQFDSFLGVRHGPQVFINKDCVVFASLSSEENIRKYELDFLSELKEKKQGAGVVAVCCKTDDTLNRIADTIIEIQSESNNTTVQLEDSFRSLTDVVAAQILATLKSVVLGYKPDDPSPEGIISRTVKEFTIYE